MAFFAIALYSFYKRRGNDRHPILSGIFFACPIMEDYFAINSVDFVEFVELLFNWLYFSNIT